MWSQESLKMEGENRRAKGKCNYRKGTGRGSIAGFEDAGRWPWSKECGQTLKTGKDKEKDSPLELSERKADLPTHWF